MNLVPRMRKRNLRRVDFRRHHLGCATSHHHLGCHHPPPRLHRHAVTLAWCGIGTRRRRIAPGRRRISPGREYVLGSEYEREGGDYTSAPAATLVRASRGWIIRAWLRRTAINRGTPSISAIAALRRLVSTATGSSSSVRLPLYSEAARCAGQSYSCWNRNGQPTGAIRTSTRSDCEGWFRRAIRSAESRRRAAPIRCVCSALLK